MGQTKDAQRPGSPDTMEEKTSRPANHVNGSAVTAVQTNHEVTLDNPKDDGLRSPVAKPDEDLTTRVFQFLSTATPGTLGGVAVGLAAVTYFVLGQIGLLLIGAFAGIVLFIQWEQRNNEVTRVVRGERGYDVLARLLEAKIESRNAIENEQNPDEGLRALVHSLDHLPPETRDAINELMDAVIRDYVKWWYSPIVPSDKFFPLSARKTLSSFISAIASQLSRKRPADAFLDFLTNTSSIVIVFLSELSNAFAELPTDSKVSAPDAIYNYLSAHPDSNLSNLLSQRQQAGKFRMVSEDLMGFLDRTTYECEPARVFLREIMAGVVLEMSLQTCSAPEWINSWIVYLLEAGEPDFSQAIDVGMQTGPSSEATFLDVDGNVGNIGVNKGNRNSFDAEKARRKESMAHKKKLSKADEEMEMAMEEMKRMNQMIADADARRVKDEAEKSRTDIAERTLPTGSRSAHEASERLADAFKRNADELDIQSETAEKHAAAVSNPRPSESLDRASVKESISDGLSSKDEALHTPGTGTDSSSQSSSPKPTSGFTNFDQLLPPASADDGESSSDEARKPLPPLTLHNATITVLDEPGDSKIRSKPSWDYLIQIEPVTTTYPGWMIVRRYNDFEKLHEVLRRIAAISGATAFSEQHNALPTWKIHTRSSLRGELERYLRDACWYQSLADCEGMKRFLEKDTLQPQNNGNSGLQAFEKLGKNVLGVLTTAPLEGSKAVVGGVTGVLGNMGLGIQKKPTNPTSPAPAPPSSSLQDVTAASRINMVNPVNGSRKPRDSMDSQRSSVVSLQPGKMAPMERRPSYNSQGEPEDSLRPSRRSDQWDRPFTSARSSREHSRASSVAPLRSPSSLSLDGMKLPPPPDAIADDYESPISPKNPHLLSHHTRSMTSPNLGQKGFEVPLKGVKQSAPLTEQETRVAVELLFAVINELYTLSSAWNIRRTLLAAAKSFLLRPGNPSLVSIQSLIQSSVLEANTSDTGIAAHLRKLRENTMPTEEERAAWPAELTPEEKEKLRIKARRMLIQSGVPAALTGVMGQSATSEALGRIFDSLQVEEVARGLMFGVLLQAVRTVTH